MNFEFTKLWVVAFLLVLLMASVVNAGCGCDTREIESTIVSEKKLQVNPVPTITSEYKKEFYRQALNISKEAAVSIPNAESLIERSRDDSANFQNILRVARVVLAEESRMIAVNTLMKMDRNFVDRFAERAMKNEAMKERARSQISNYIRSLSKTGQAETTVSKTTGAEASGAEVTGADASGEFRKVIRKMITKERIKLLFDKEITTEEFIREVLEK